MGTALSSKEIESALAAVPGWVLKSGKLSQEFQFDGFKEAMAFVNHVAEFAEARNHHPDIHIYYNKVVLELISHDVGGITDRDVRFVREFY